MGKRIVALTITELEERWGISRQGVMKRLKKEGKETFKKPNKDGKEVLHANVEEEMTPEEEVRDKNEARNNELAQASKVSEGLLQLQANLQQQFEDQREQLKEKDRQLEGLNSEMREMSKGQGWKLPAVAGSLLFVGLAGLFFGWTGRDDMAKEAKDNHLKDIEFLGEQLSSQNNLIQAVQQDSKLERDAWVKREREARQDEQALRDKLEAERQEAQQLKEELRVAKEDLKASNAEAFKLSEYLEVVEKGGNILNFILPIKRSGNLVK
jgi:hypothetical protein